MERSHVGGFQFPRTLLFSSPLLAYSNQPKALLRSEYFHVVTTNIRGGLGDTQRQARELISGPCLGAKARFLSFDRTQSRAVTDFLTGHNTLRRHLHLPGLMDSPLCRRCGAVEETSAHTLCECEALASLRHAYLGSFILEPEDIKRVSLGAIWNLAKQQGSHKLIWGTKGPLIKA
jgi:hypothetical protein